MEGLSVDHVDIAETDSPTSLYRIYPVSLLRDSHVIRLRQLAAKRSEISIRELFMALVRHSFALDH